MPSPTHPILRHADPARGLAHDRRDPVTAARFAGDVVVLAGRLPDQPHVVNFCADRYRFAVGFAAALIRGQVTLLPSSEAPAPLAGLALRYPGLYQLHDGTAPEGGLPSCRFPDDLGGPPDAVLPELPGNQEAAILFTSGSTGAPAPNPRRWGSFVASTASASGMLGLDELPGATVVGTVPHQHSFGLESVIVLALQHGFAFDRTRALLPADILAQLEAAPEPRILVTTPVHLRSLLAEPGERPPLQRIICATAPLPATLAAEAERRFACPLMEIYGCSEIGQVAIRRTVETDIWTVIGGIELARQGDTVWAAGPAAARPAPLNDVIELLGQGRFRLHGRQSDMVNIAGKRGSLAHLNHLLTRIEGVRDGIFVMPEGDGGPVRLTAYVVAPGLTAKQILAALRREVDPAFLPRPIHFVDALPRNALGKLPRRDAERLVLEAAGR